MNNPFRASFVVLVCFIVTDAFDGGVGRKYVYTMPCGILEPRIAFDVAGQYHQNPALIETGGP